MKKKNIFEKKIHKPIKRAVFYIFISLAIFIAIVFVIAIFIPESKIKQTTEPIVATDTIKKIEYEDKKMEAFIVSTDFVSNSLKSPATAVFPAFYEVKNSVQQHKNEYKIDAYVDRKNGFGALMRTRYRCDLIYNPKTERFNLIDIKVIEK